MGINFGVSGGKMQELLERMEGCGLRENDLEETFVRSSGPGGQKVNKSSSCVSLCHVPSGLTVKMQQARSQGLNRYYARRRMCELLEEKQLGRDSALSKRQAAIRKQKDRRRRRNKANE